METMIEVERENKRLKDERFNLWMKALDRWIEPSFLTIGEKQKFHQTVSGLPTGTQDVIFSMLELCAKPRQVTIFNHAKIPMDDLSGNRLRGDHSTCENSG
jgi:hypothetical protein